MHYYAYSTDHEAPHYAVSSSVLLPHPCSAQISSSAKFPEHPQPEFFPLR
jgi:hypothetical protein